MAILKVKQSPACWCLQWPGKTDWAAHHHGTLSSLSTPPWWPHPPNLDPGSAQPSGLVRGSPKLPTDDTNKEDIWNAFLFDMAKPPLWADFPSSEYGASIRWLMVKCMTYPRDVEDFEGRVCCVSGKWTQICFKPFGITLNSLPAN